MEKITVERYKSFDGELFESEADCVEYEAAKKYQTFMRKIVSESDCVHSDTKEKAIIEFLLENKNSIIEFCKTL